MGRLSSRPSVAAGCPQASSDLPRLSGHAGAVETQEHLYIYIYCIYVILYICNVLDPAKIMKISSITFCQIAANNWIGLRTPLKTQKTKNSKPPAVHIQGYSGLTAWKSCHYSAPHSTATSPSRTWWALASIRFMMPFSWFSGPHS